MSDVTSVPDARGYFGAYGGRFIPEALVAAVEQVADEYEKAKADPAFNAELSALLKDYTGRPSPLTDVRRFSAEAGGAPAGARRVQVGVPAKDSAQTAGWYAVESPNTSMRSRGGS